ncbi:M42 family metallopeptidase [Staphylococcus massiliensis]|uniref:Glutamyl aminopeptidase, M42 family protein n=1 Tax=Staphylococcus massiliensis S46 TaxID=1229783 RepID=K9AZ32_9STAP|nr:M42 family metallopeptidase [Staphylococcus massiliensis]EKU46775.1 glutamyl aminopeptidase, M42 family protein [Staphylococcus massiliensis S46]MCG3399309.1 M42 family metallopeptidase [Staphylococcus massiliensis]MCG3402381.1 M42 family metallopeptidase [Staphylococcus massiliensis]MCG3411654.1 M42 family metallopeptidase [Staphylococcus massiliensis]PNZ99220.1 M42 family peptidase [Staphylococcus massiliensis CCUG 55927]
MDKTTQLLKQLTDLNGIAGHEYNVKKEMKSLLEPYSDELIEDNLGGIFGKKNATNGSKTLMLAGHLDEIGFMVTYIEDNGYIKFTPVGGWWNQVMLSQKLTITTDEGKTYRGVIGTKPPHILTPEERKKPVEIKDMYIDLGVKDKKEVEALGIELGNMITPYSEFETLANDNYLCAKAFDNRFGCALSVDVMEALKDEDININLVSGANVQEEVGLRGAKVAANKIKPDLAIAVDVGVAYDTPGLYNEHHNGKLGDGPLVLLLDATNIGHYGFRKYIKEVAKDKGINVQWDSIPGGGTDAGSMHLANEGAPTISIGIPLRYMHSNVSVIHKDDYLNAVKLVTEIVKGLDDDKVESIKW